MTEFIKIFSLQFWLQSIELNDDMIVNDIDTLAPFIQPREYVLQ